MSCKGIFWKQNSLCSNFDFLVTMLKLEPRLIANTNMTEEILKYVGSGTGWARVIMLKSLEERFQKCIFLVRFNIRNSQKFQFKPGCFHQHFTVMEKHGLYDIHHTVCKTGHPPPHRTSITSDIHHTGLNIFCQQFGDICRLEGVCAHFGRRVREYVFSWISMCHLNMGWVGIEYSLPTIGKYVSVEYMYTLSRWQTRFFFFFWCKIVFLSLIKAWPGSFRWISPLGILSH